MSDERFFDYAQAALPGPGPLASGNGGKSPPKHEPAKHGHKHPAKPDDEKPTGKEGPIRTQMVGEAPDDDLGYDPNKIPVEDI